MSTEAGQTEEGEIEEELATGPLTKLLAKVGQAVWQTWRGWRAPKQEEDRA